MTKSDRQRIEIRSASGMVDSRDRLLVFLYLLMRDHITPGAVAEIVTKHNLDVSRETFEFCNGWLAQYAEYVATQLRRETNTDTEKKA